MTTVDRDSRRRLHCVLVVATLASGVLWATVPSSYPTSATWAGLEGWYETAGPSPAAISLLWLAALVVASWLLLACVLQLIAGRRRRGWLRRLADSVAPAALRGLAVASVTTALALSPPVGAGAGDAPGTATLHPLGADDATTTSSPVVTPPAVEPAEGATPALVPATPPAEYTIRPGDSFWSVARDRLAEDARGDLPASSHHDYWRRLIAANVDRLVDPGNADLLYPGQVLVLPPLT